MSYRRLALPEGDQPLLLVPCATLDNAGVPSPFDLTGAVCTMTVKASADTADAAGTQIAGTPQHPPTAGVVTVQVPGEVTASPGAYWWNLRVQTSDGQKRTPACGPLDVVDG